MSQVKNFEKPYFGLMDLMKRQGITQGEMADRLQMDRATFNIKINRNNGRDFTLSEALKISQELKTALDNFF